MRWTICVYFISVITTSTSQTWRFFDFWTDLFRPLPHNPRDGFVPDYTPENDEEFDFIVVGAGSAGCVLANRLTEVRQWKVLLLEAGGNENFFSDVPILSAFLSLTPLNWGYNSEPEAKACRDLRGNVCFMPRGKVLGGSSVLNFLIYQRGHPADYDDWARMGNEGWSYEEVLSYFKKSENIQIDQLKNSSYHGKGGYLDIEYSPYKSPLESAFKKAGQELGYEWRDPNGDKVIGFSKPQATMRKGRRCSTSKAFLEPIRFRENLKVSKYSTVTKILIDSESKTAYGVEFLKGNVRRRVRATREVVLSSGTIGSAQLLMLSGVGPRDHLQEVGIWPLVDLPVGQNLQDHVTFSGNAFIVNDSRLCVNDMTAASPAAAAAYLAGRGPLTLPGGAAGLAFIRSKYARDDHAQSRPDIELVMGAGSLAGDLLGILRSLLGVTDQWYWQVYGSLPFADRQRSFAMNPVLIRPRSIGRLWLRSASHRDHPRLHPNYFDHPDDLKALVEGVRLRTFAMNPVLFRLRSVGCLWLRSASHRDHPQLHPNYFDHPDDLKALVEGVRLVQKVIGTTAFQRYQTRLHDTPFPGCEHLVFDSSEYWECAIMQTSITLDHQVGTCKMAPAGDPSGVVSPRLRVHGLSGLRVADASVMPRIPAAHTHAPVLMIAEKAADLIKEDWGVLTDLRARPHDN